MTPAPKLDSLSWMPPCWLKMSGVAQNGCLKKSLNAWAPSRTESRWDNLSGNNTWPHQLLLSHIQEQPDQTAMPDTFDDSNLISGTVPTPEPPTDNTMDGEVTPLTSAYTHSTAINRDFHSRFTLACSLLSNMFPQTSQ